MIPPANEKWVQKYAIAYPGTIVTGRLRVTGGGAGNSKVRVNVYADSGGAPGALLGRSDEVTILSSQAQSFVDLPFSTPVTVVAGSSYWFGPHQDQQIRIQYQTGALDLYKNADTYSDGPTNPFGTPTINAAFAFLGFAVGVSVVWPAALFVFPEQPTLVGGGTFTKQIPGRAVTPPFYAVYPWLTYGSEAGSTIAGQGGSINVY